MTRATLAAILIAGAFIYFDCRLLAQKEDYASLEKEAALAIAWFIVDTGVPSDCEGYIPCYTNVMNSVVGEFLRRYRVASMHRRLSRASTAASFSLSKACRNHTQKIS